MGMRHEFGGMFPWVICVLRVVLTRVVAPKASRWGTSARFLAYLGRGLLSPTTKEIQLVRA